MRSEQIEPAQRPSLRSGHALSEERLMNRRGIWGVVAAISVGLAAWLITAVTVAMVIVH
jgi:hypothetical protein